MTSLIDTKACRSDLDTLVGAIVNFANHALKTAVDAAETSAKTTTLFKDQSGATRASIKGQVFGQQGTLVASGMSRYLEYGTRPHPIAPKTAGGVLAFMQNGTLRFAKYVLHPGTDRRPFMTTARDYAEQVLEQNLDSFINRAIERT